MSSICPTPDLTTLNSKLSQPYKDVPGELDDLVMLRGYKYVLSKAGKPSRSNPSFTVLCDHHGPRSDASWFKSNCRHKITFKPKNGKQKLLTGPWEIDWSLSEKGFRSLIPHNHGPKTVKPVTKVPTPKNPKDDEVGNDEGIELSRESKHSGTGTKDNSDSAKTRATSSSTSAGSCSSSCTSGQAEFRKDQSPHESTLPGMTPPASLNRTSTPTKTTVHREDDDEPVFIDKPAKVTNQSHTDPEVIMQGTQGKSSKLMIETNSAIITGNEKKSGIDIIKLKGQEDAKSREKVDSENQQLKRENEQLKTSHEKLKNDHQALQQDYQIMNDDYASILTANLDLTVLITEKDDEIEKLKNNNKSLTDEVLLWKDQLTEYQAKVDGLEPLQIENEELRQAIKAKEELAQLEEIEKRRIIEKEEEEKRRIEEERKRKLAEEAEREELKEKRRKLEEAVAKGRKRC